MRFRPKKVDWRDFRNSIKTAWWQCGRDRQRLQEIFWNRLQLWWPADASRPWISKKPSRFRRWRWRLELILWNTTKNNKSDEKNEIKTEPYLSEATGRFLQHKISSKYSCSIPVTAIFKNSGTAEYLRMTSRMFGENRAKGSFVKQS